VDDEAPLLDFGEQMLIRFGYTVLKAPNGETAVKLYREKKEVISIIILDMIMPGMGGMRCLEELLKIKPEAKVIITSGYYMNDKKRYTIEACGAEGFIRKPYDVDQMLKLVRDVLGREN